MGSQREVLLGSSTSDLPIGVSPPLHNYLFLFPFLITTKIPSPSFTALAVILTICTFLHFRRLTAPPAFLHDAFDYGLSHSHRAWLRCEEARFAEVGSQASCRAYPCSSSLIRVCARLQNNVASLGLCVITSEYNCMARKKSRAFRSAVW